MAYLYQGNAPIAISEKHALQHGVNGNDPITPESIGAAPLYTYGTEDLEAGVSELETGKLYFVYE